MRNFETEIEDLRKDIQQLKIQRLDKEAQLKQVIREQCESEIDKEAIVFKDGNDTEISVGD